MVAVHEFIVNLPRGYEIIGEQQLSEGQMRRIAIARHI